MPDLFSFIFTYREATYFSQYKGKTVREALESWKRREGELFVGAWQDGEAKAVFAAIAREQPIQMSGLEGIWCSSTKYRNALALLTIVRTASGDQVG